MRSRVRVRQLLEGFAEKRDLKLSVPIFDLYDGHVLAATPHTRHQTARRSGLATVCSFPAPDFFALAQIEADQIL